MSGKQFKKHSQLHFQAGIEKNNSNNNDGNINNNNKEYR